MIQHTQIDIQTNPSQAYLQHQPMLPLECGLHTLNNLLGQPHFTKQDLEKLSNDYDVNVMLKALDMTGHKCIFIDNRKEFNVQILQEMLGEDEAIGFVVNIEQQSSFLGTLCKKVFCLSFRHWCCVRRVGIKYALLDSLVDEPLFLQTINHVTNFIQAQVKKKGEAMVVVKNRNKNGIKEKQNINQVPQN